MLARVPEVGQSVYWQRQEWTVEEVSEPVREWGCTESLVTVVPIKKRHKRAAYSHRVVQACDLEF